MENKINIRKAIEKDFDAIYAIGRITPELQVSSMEEFVDSDELLFAIKNKGNVFLVATINDVTVGFVYAATDDLDKPLYKKWACLVYLVVLPEYRKQGIAQKLYDVCVKELKMRNISHIYVWANTESDGAIIEFMRKQGFCEGHKYTWMDKKI